LNGQRRRWLCRLLPLRPLRVPPHLRIAVVAYHLNSPISSLTACGFVFFDNTDYWPADLITTRPPAFVKIGKSIGPLLKLLIC